jgi:hypothetical protein
MRQADDIHQLNACLDGDVDAEAGEISGAFSRNACGQQNFASEIHLFFWLRCLFELFHRRHGACGVVYTLVRLRASVAFGDRIML